MVTKSVTEKTACVVGLGYVGLPLAIDLAQHMKVIGYRRNAKKVQELNNDATLPENFMATTDPEYIREADYIIVCVPTPVTKAKMPDISYVANATHTVGKYMKKGAIVVGESTVYPGLTEEIMVPILEKESGMTCGLDFKVGYSPERINPGDLEHTLEHIYKIVAGMDEQSTAELAELYGMITNVYLAPDIRTAEAAKVIENVQRDLNIALFNELSLIFEKMDIDMQAVIDAAATKWNFIRFEPGLVGGHCIPVDPYYLVYKAQEFGYHPQVILAGRAINDSMAEHVGEMAVKGLNEAGKVIRDSKVLILGLTYKENVADTREGQVYKIVNYLKEFGVAVYGYDPLLTEDEVRIDGLEFLSDLQGTFDGVVLAVPHDEFRKMGPEAMLGLMGENPVLVDVKGVFRDDVDPAKICYKKL